MRAGHVTAERLSIRLIASRLQCCAPGYNVPLQFAPSDNPSIHGVRIESMARHSISSNFPNAQETIGGRMKKFLLIFAIPLLFSVLGSTQSTPVSTPPNNSDEPQPRMFFPH